MLKHYSHIRMQAKRDALEAVWRKDKQTAESRGGEPDPVRDAP